MKPFYVSPEQEKLAQTLRDTPNIGSRVGRMISFCGLVHPPNVNWFRRRNSTSIVDIDKLKELCASGQIHKIRALGLKSISFLKETLNIPHP
jgi:hypothetical protein